jgi:putative ABC transport system substrate-binding protein
MTNRRAFITLLGGTAAAWPLAARAQQPAMPVIGFLRDASLPAFDRVTAFHQGMKETGYVEGQNVVIEHRSAEGQTDRLPLLVAEPSSPAGSPDRWQYSCGTRGQGRNHDRADRLCDWGDPVRDGLVASLNRPGGNVTGISFIGVELGEKQLGLLRELRPGAARIAVLVDPRWPTTERFVSELRAAASAVGQQLIVLYVSSDREIETAFTTLVQRRADALHTGIGSFVLSQRERIVALAARHRIPAIYTYRDYVAAGGLMSYGTSVNDAYRLAGIYAGRILKGEKPGDLPVLLPTKFELVINAKTAKALGLEIPDKLLALADEVIE